MGHTSHKQWNARNKQTENGLKNSFDSVSEAVYMKVTNRMSQNNQAMMLCCSTCCKPHSSHKTTKHTYRAQWAEILEDHTRKLCLFTNLMTR